MVPKGGAERLVRTVMVKELRGVRISPLNRDSIGTSDFATKDSSIDVEEGLCRCEWLENAVVLTAGIFKPDDLRTPHELFRNDSSQYISDIC